MLKKACPQMFQNSRNTLEFKYVPNLSKVLPGCGDVRIWEKEKKSIQLNQLAFWYN